MGEAIGEVLPVAAGVALGPVPIVAVTLMLVTGRARVNGPAFVVVQPVLGALLLLVAVRRYRGRQHGDEGAPAPTWMVAVDAFGPAKAAAGATLVGGAIGGFTA